MKNKRLIKTLFKLRSVYPAQALLMLAQVPGIGSPELKKNAGLLNEAYQKLDDMYEMFSHFTVNEWIYETKAIMELDAQMTPEDCRVFYLDPKTFTWK